MAANQAEVDLVVNASGALPDLERQLTRIIDAVEAGADEIDVEATLGVQQAVDTITAQLDQVIASVDRQDPTVDVDAALDLRESLRNLREDVADVTRDVNSGLVDPLQLTAGLDFTESLENITRDLEFLAEDAERSTQIRLQVELDEERIRRFREQIDALEGSDRRLGQSLVTVGRQVGLFTASIGGLGVAAGGLLNTLVAVATAVEQVGPAAAVGTSALLTLKLAAGTVQLAMIGVEDAIKKAFDPNVKPEELEKSLKALAPEARKFVVELQGMSKELSAIQQGVQNRAFKDFDEILRTLATDLGPTVTTSLNRAADSLNAMGRNAATAASQLAKQGVLGQALEGANDALETLEKVPARAARSFGFLAAASAPALNRIAVAVDDVSLKVQTRLQGAFESGALEKAIDQAVSTLAEFGRALGNFGSGLRNIFSGLTQNGRGLFDILEQISQSFEDVTATKGFQAALTALAETASAFTRAVLPLLSQALQALGPIFTALAGPLQNLFQTLGGALSKILAALAPVLAAAATAVGALVTALSPLLTLVGDLIAALLPALTPVFEAFAKVFAVIAPFVQAVAETLSSLLVPVLEQLGPIVEALLIPFVTLYQTVFPQLTAIIEELRPSFERIGEALGRVAELAAPLIQRIVELAVKIVGDLLPSIQPLIDVFIFLAENALKLVANVLEEFVVPALEVVTKLLNGEFFEAVQQAHQIVDGFKTRVVLAFTDLVNSVQGAIGRLVLSVIGKVTELRNQFVANVTNTVNDVVAKFRELPGRVVAAVGNLSTALFSAGVNLISGLAAGIQSRVGGLLSQAQSIANSIVSTIEGALDIHSPSRRTRKTGQNVVKGLEQGMKDRLANVRKVALEITEATVEALPRTFTQFTDPKAANRSVLTPLNLPTLTGTGTNVVNVYIGGQLVKQIINDQFKALVNNRDRAFAQGVRI